LQQCVPAIDGKHGAGGKLMRRRNVRQRCVARHAARIDSEARKKLRASQAKQSEIARLEEQIAETETAIKDLEQQMAAPGFYDDRAASQAIVDRHQALMWKVGDLMHQWEELQTLLAES
jgi:hypothetical protein